jgi:hypothetical protein
MEPYYAWSWYEDDPAKARQDFLRHYWPGEADDSAELHHPDSEPPCP